MSPSKTEMARIAGPALSSEPTPESWPHNLLILGASDRYFNYGVPPFPTCQMSTLSLMFILWEFCGAHCTCLVHLSYCYSRAKYMGMYGRETGSLFWGIRVLKSKVFFGPSEWRGWGWGDSSEV